MGATIVGTSDSHGAIYDPSGLDIEKILTIKAEKKSLSEYTGVQKLTNPELLEKECDILIPAALENQITEENAGKIHARLILELANGPVTPDADNILFQK